MPASRAAVLMFVLMLGVFASGCGGTANPTASTAAQAAGQSAAVGDGLHEYRAVCATKELHDGNEYVLSTWLETKDKAKTIGDYHAEFKYKGHTVRIEERLKRPGVTPPK